MLRLSSLGLLVLLAASPAQGQKAMTHPMTDQRPTAAFRAEHRTVQEHLCHAHDGVGALSTQFEREQGFNAGADARSALALDEIARHPAGAKP